MEKENEMKSSQEKSASSLISCSGRDRDPGPLISSVEAQLMQLACARSVHPGPRQLHPSIICDQGSNSTKTWCLPFGGLASFLVHRRQVGVCYAGHWWHPHPTRSPFDSRAAGHGTQRQPKVCNRLNQYHFLNHPLTTLLLTTT